MQYSLVFFGSFQDYSVAVLEKLLKNFNVTAIITVPPRPAGRDLKLKPTAVAEYTKNHHLPLFELERLDTIPNLPKPDFIVVAGYGQLIPPAWLDWPKIMAINLHPSLLPLYPGRFPAEWAILNGETETGVTLIKMNAKFDKGEILAQSQLEIGPDDTRDSLYAKLFEIGGDLLIRTLPQIAAEKVNPTPQPEVGNFYARQLTREDGFVSWEEFSAQLNRRDHNIYRKLRALAPWPGVWTTLPDSKRLILKSFKPQITVQIEGKTPRPWPLT